MMMTLARPSQASSPTHPTGYLSSLRSTARTLSYTSNLCAQPWLPLSLVRARVGKRCEKRERKNSTRDLGGVMADTENRAAQREDVRQLLTDALHPNDYNPNRMAGEEFTELVEEVRHLGRLPKPVVVRNGYAPDEYLIVDGEHGWRAAKEVGLAEVTCEV